MIFSKLPIQFAGPIFMLVFASIYTAKSEAALISLNWTGQVTSVTSFKEDAVPTAILLGSVVTGNLVFESSQYDSSSSILGSISSGINYHYTESLQQTVNIETWKWAINGADVSLVENLSTNRQAFDVYSTSEDYNYSLFPNYVGRFEYGFALFDRVVPLQLFDSSQMQSPDLNEVTDAGGFLTTRLWDEQRNIVNGYYITFDINEVSYSPVPLPPTLFLFISGLGAILFKSKRKQIL